MRCEAQPSEHVRAVQLPSGGPSIQTQLALLASEPLQTEGKRSPWRLVRLPPSKRRECSPCGVSDERTRPARAQEVVQGARDSAEADQSVMALKFHHALSDGLGLMEVYRHEVVDMPLHVPHPAVSARVGWPTMLWNLLSGAYPNLVRNLLRVERPSVGPRPHVSRLRPSRGR